MAVRIKIYFNDRPSLTQKSLDVPNSFLKLPWKLILDSCAHLEQKRQHTKSHTLKEVSGMSQYQRQRHPDLLTRVTSLVSWACNLCIPARRIHLLLGVGDAAVAWHQLRQFLHAGVELRFVVADELLRWYLHQQISHCNNAQSHNETSRSDK